MDVRRIGERLTENMDKKYTVASARGGPKKYLITFAAFLAAAAIVIAVFALITNSHAAEWLSGNNGVARESMFPFVFTSGGSLYILNEELKVSGIDDNVKNTVHDTEFERVYYTRNGDLYEYDISKNTRVKLCGGVKDFFLFEERKSIMYTTENGGVYVYKYNGKSSVMLRESFTEIEGTVKSVTAGEECFAYLDKYDAESGTAELYVADINGKSRLICDRADAARSIYIWKGNSFISYYSNSELVIARQDGTVCERLKNASVVIAGNRNYATAVCTDIKSYGDAKNVKYILSDINEDGSEGTLQYVTKSAAGISLKKIADGVKSIVGCIDEDCAVVFSKESGSGADIYKTQKGGGPVKITHCDIGESVFFDASSRCVYIKNTENRLVRIDINDRDFSEITVSYDADTVYPYAGKSFTVVVGNDKTTQSIITKNNKIESYPVNEARLYGKYDNKYLLCRENANGAFSLDFVNGREMTRIAESAARNVVIDKKIENVVYLAEGKLYIWRGGESFLIGEYPSGFESVRIEAKDKI